jgi:hypothetical protein
LKGYSSFSLGDDQKSQKDPGSDERKNLFETENDLNTQKMIALAPKFATKR